MLVAGSCTSDVDWSGSTEIDAPSAASGSDAEPSRAASTCASTPGDPSGEAATVLEVAESAMQEDDLRGVLISVARGDEEVVTAALGESVDGVPASTALRFFDGAVVFTHLGTLMLLLDRDGVLDMDAPIDEHLDGVPGGDRITPRMLMSSTSGLVDYVPMEEFVDQLYADPFRPFTTPELDAFVYAEPLLFEPGTNVSYTHQGFRLAGAVIEAASGQRLDDLLAERITEPLGMTSTEVVESVDVSGPVLRTYTDERGQYEESTSWSPAWGVPERAMQVMDICDLRRSARGIGSGELLHPGELEQLTARSDVTAAAPSDDCPSCIPQSDELYLGLGVTVAGDWIIQTPSFTGFAAVQAYLPSQDLSIAVANNLGPEGDVGTNASTAILAELARQLTPDSPLPARMG
jgi:CubicO group peptidase (beta-lactamase class C family)